MTNKLLIVTGPTATGKTSFALHLGKELGGEIISADSQQAVSGRDIVTGKDLPKNAKRKMSNVKFQNGYLKYFLIDSVAVWGYDLVPPGEKISVSLWQNMFHKVAADIWQRGLLPIVVGGSGLYIKSVIHPFNHITIPPNSALQAQLTDQTVEYLFTKLQSLDPDLANSLNNSDRHNPRRLIRKIEIATYKNNQRGEVYATENCTLKTDQLVLGLTAPREYLFAQVDRRVDSRIAQGAAKEDLGLAADPPKWKHYERGLVKKQLTWFKKQSGIHWLDISQPGWNSHALTVVTSWYNELKTVN